MAEIIFSQRLYSDLKERRLYASLQEAFTADLKTEKTNSALCVSANSVISATEARICWNMPSRKKHRF